MLVPQADLTYSIEEVHVLEIGTLYFFQNFVISEIHQGVHIDCSLAQRLVDLVISHYGKDSEIALISNRHYSYSIDPNYWEQFFKEYNFVHAYALVHYRSPEHSNIALEKLFFTSPIQTFQNLNEAISWSLSKLNITKKKVSNNQS